MQIFCENPTIIVNPHINQYVYKYGNYVLDGVVHIVNDVRLFSQGYTHKYFSPARYGVTMENIENYGVMTDKGFQPMFFAVPCGRCVLCREKKASEWSFRALCENQSSISQPLFVTLTYDEKHKPSRGVEKKALQNFMKRLRRNLDKKGIEHNIRYFACAEYGKKSKRPHYHLILWNFPRTTFPSITSCLHFIEYAWCVPVVDRFKQPVYLKNGAPKTESQGFAYCVPCQKGAISYVMKYMRKDCIPPEGCNDVFFLSSRRNGGIGAPHFKQYIDFYRQNPDCIEFTVYDRYSGKQQTKLLPPYFRSLVWPSASRLISKEDRDVYQRFINNLQKRAAYELPFEGVVSENSVLLFEDERKLIKKWSVLGVTYDPDFVDTHFRFRLLHMSSEDREKTYQRLCEAIESQLDYLEKVEVPTAYFVSREISLDLRRKFLEENIQKRELDLNEVKWNIINTRKLAEYKEKL
jgi:hypothetical protein